MKSLLFLISLSLIFRLAISFSVYSGDVNNHVGWASSILKSGFSGAYDREYVGIMQPTYPPLSLLGFTTSTGLYKLTYAISQYLNIQIPWFPSKLIWTLEDQDILPAFNKIFAIASDIGIGLIIYGFTRSKLVSSAYIFNPAVWYISSLWGQIESFPLFFLLLCYWYISRNRPFMAHAAFVAALLSKQSMIIFIPAFVIFFLKKFTWKVFLKGLLVQLSIFYLLYSIFSSGGGLMWPFKVYVNRIQTGSGSIWITDHAFNLWYLLTRDAKIPDSTPVFYGLSAALVGAAAFLALSGLTILKFIRSKISISNVFFVSSLIPMFSFLLLTKMHERYFAFALPFLLLSASKFRWLWAVYTAASLAHLANLYHIWWFPRIPALITWLSLDSTINLLIATFTISTMVMAVKYVREP